MSCESVFAFMIVNHAEASCVATNTMGFESKHKDDIQGSLAHFSELVLNVCLRYCCLPRMNDINDHSPPPM